MTDDAFIDQLRATEENVHATSSEIDQLIMRLNVEKDSIERKFRELSEKAKVTNLDDAEVAEFWQQPYAIVSRRPDEFYVVTPAFTGMSIGWLEKKVKGWNFFVVNKFVTWMSPLPPELEDKFHFPRKMPLKVLGRHMITGAKDQEEAFQRYKEHLNARDGKDRIVIKQGHEFRLMADMINDGILPFIPRPVAADDLRDYRMPEGAVLGALHQGKPRRYQLEAWKKFMDFGAVGVYWAPGAGKTVLGLNACARIKGRKLIVVPTSTLREQWEKRLQTFMSDIAGEVTVATYQAYDKLKRGDWALIIFDECHRLPANTFSRLATVPAKYRIGLSATPYREDGRTDFIFALTGFPIGIDWRELIEHGFVNRPIVRVYVCSGNEEKMRKVGEFLKDDKRTLVYTYWLDLGEKIAQRFDLPFIHGGTSARLDKIAESQSFVISSVGAEGLSIPDLERTIEVAGQYGSRREEGQLLGRSFHSQKGEPEHFILMTDEELELYGKRLLAIEEKGFKIEFVR